MSLRHLLVVATLSCMAVAAADMQAQQPVTSSSPGDPGAGDATQPQLTMPQDAEKSQALTLSGCLMRHREVPARTNAPAVDRTLKHEGYILVDANTVAHHKGINGMRPAASLVSTSHEHGSTDSPPLVSQTSNVGDSQMFKVEGLPDVDLEPFAGKRVTLMGDLRVHDRGQRVASTLLDDTDHDAAPFQATMIHPASGRCRESRR